MYMIRGQKLYFPKILYFELVLAYSADPDELPV